MNCSIPGLPVHHQLPEFTQTHVHRVGDAIQPSHPLSSPSPPVPNPSQHQSLFIESSLCMRRPKYWSFSFRISPSNEHPGLISFRMDWLALLAVQGTPKSLLQHHSSKASILRHSAFFTVQLSHPYMTTGKTIVGNIISWKPLCLKSLVLFWSRQGRQWASLVAQMIKNPPAMWETWVQLGSSPEGRVRQPTPVFLPGESPWTKEPGRLQSMGSQRVEHDWVTKHTHTDREESLKNFSRRLAWCACLCREWTGGKSQTEAGKLLGQLLS